mmetsp:Transcript_88769/g.206601  ORF Transcript_88769/g.206601 Transcript_88769/m.206601 type:complete len:245 (+) Transcript_88769:573-1307(+)
MYGEAALPCAASCRPPTRGRSPLGGCLALAALACWPGLSGAEACCALPAGATAPCGLIMGVESALFPCLWWPCSSSMNVGPPMFLACTVTQPSGCTGMRMRPVGSATMGPRWTQISFGRMWRSSLLETSCVSRTMTSWKSLLESTRQCWPTNPSDALRRRACCPGGPAPIGCWGGGAWPMGSCPGGGAAEALLGAEPTKAEGPEAPAREPVAPTTGRAPEPGTAAGPVMPGILAQCSKGVPVGR